MLGCSEPVQPAPPELDLRAAAVTSQRGFAPAQATALQRLAKVLAQKLSQPHERQRLYEALQASTFSESKLVGREFLQSAAGRGLFHAGELRDVPDIDVYIPFSAHRATWTPDAPLAVAALVDETSELRAYLPRGESFVIDRSSTEPTPIAVLLLGPV